MAQTARLPGSFSRSASSVEAEKFAAQGVEFGVRLLADELQDVRGLFP